MNYAKIDNVSCSIYPNTCDKVIQYGTAGFRTRAELLDHIVFRMGLLAVLRSKHCGASTGIMITASHNEEADNGVKLVDPAGEMLSSEWENLADELGNVHNNDLISRLQDVIKKFSIDENAPANVIVGRDTRASGERLLKAALDGIEAANGTLKNLGVVTTPELHYCVACTNDLSGCGVPTTDGYISKLSSAYRANKSADKKNYTAELYLDAANGVGAIAGKAFEKELANVLKINIFNDGSGILNHECGADYVKINQSPPINNPSQCVVRCVSIDGDADRIIYYYIDANNTFHMLDGDKIAALIIGHIKELITISGLSLTLGLVQTAYANGASTSYVTDILKVPVAFTNTGVKFLHNRAQEFDIGVYFEANGHGTVIFKSEIVDKIRATALNQIISEENRLAAQKLCNLIDMINQTVGDALSDMLLIETILYDKDWNIEMWDVIYTDLASKQLKVKVSDRNVIKTTDAERKCTSPVGLQQSIDDIVLRYKHGRSFVRPSGTEDIVRVYAECENSVDVEKLAAEVALAVYQFAGGIGAVPVVPN